MTHLSFIEKISLQTIKNLSESNLSEALEEVQPPHPIAQNKFQALDWNIKHVMWHCGQIAMINRIVHQRFSLKSINS